MKKRLALIMATAMIASALSGTVAFASEADDTAAAAEETKDDAAGGDTMTMDEALKIIQEKTGFDNNTMLYLQFYRYGESMIIRLAQAMQ